MIAALGLGGCSAGAYVDEVTGMATAGRALVAAPQGYQTARQEIDQFRYDFSLAESVRAGEISLADMDCSTQSTAVDTAYRDLQARRAAPDQLSAAFARFANVSPCYLRIAGVDGEAVLRPPTPGAHQPTGREVEIAELLGEYLSGLEAIVGGKTAEDIDKALLEARTASAELLGELPAGGTVFAASSGFVFTLFSIGLENRRYEALRDAVRAFDPAWRDAAPEIAASLRDRHLSLISDRTRAAQIVSLQMADAFDPEGTDVRSRTDTFVRLQPILAARNTELRAALIADPGRTVAAFTKAHGKLAEALADPDRQIAGVLQAVTDLIESARDLDAAINDEEA